MAHMPSVVDKNLFGRILLCRTSTDSINRPPGILSATNEVVGARLVWNFGRGAFGKKCKKYVIHKILLDNDFKYKKL